jgi:hypothetical protein
MPFKYSQNLEKLSKTKTWLALQVLAKTWQKQTQTPSQYWQNLAKPGPIKPFEYWQNLAKPKPPLSSMGKTMQNQNHPSHCGQNRAKPKPALPRIVPFGGNPRTWSAATL